MLSLNDNRSPTTIGYSEPSRSKPVVADIGWNVVFVILWDFKASGLITKNVFKTLKMI